MIHRTANGSYEVGRVEVFLNVGFWRWGPIRIGTTRLYRVGPVRVFVHERNRRRVPS